MEPIERGALALQKAWDAHDAPAMLPPLTFAADEGRYLVRAVLQAIREPSEGMLEAGMDASWPGEEAVYDDEHDSLESATRAGWHAMIDAALNECATPA